MKILLIRHGKTEGNERKLYTGKTDEALSLAGITELQHYKGEGIYPLVDAVYTSPMKRCLESRELIYPKVPFSLISEISECDFGEFEGKSYQDLSDRQDYIKWVDGKQAPPGGEKTVDFKRRVWNGFEKILDNAFQENRETVAIFLHGGSVMVIMEKLSQKPESFYEHQVKNGHGFCFEMNETGWRENPKISDLRKLQEVFKR